MPLSLLLPLLQLLLLLIELIARLLLSTRGDDTALLAVVSARSKVAQRERDPSKRLAG